MRQPQGFTLLEVLVALLILSVISALLAQLLIASASARDAAVQMNTAVQLADEIMTACMLEKQSGCAPDLSSGYLASLVRSAQSMDWQVHLQAKISLSFPSMMELIVTIDGPDLKHSVTLTRLVDHETS